MPLLITFLPVYAIFDKYYPCKYEKYYLVIGDFDFKSFFSGKYCRGG